MLIFSAFTALLQNFLINNLSYKYFRSMFSWSFCWCFLLLNLFHFENWEIIFYSQQNYFLNIWCWHYRSSHPPVFLAKCVLKIWIKFTGEYPCWDAISIKLLCNFIEIALQHGCSPVNLLHIFRAPFYKNTYGRLLLAVGRIKIFCVCKYSW